MVKVMLVNCDYNPLDNMIDEFGEVGVTDKFIKLMEEKSSNPARQQAGVTERTLVKTQQADRIALWLNGRVALVGLDKIACCFLQKGQRKATVVAQNKLYESTYNLNEFLQKIGKEKLVRCHRSFAINPDYLLELDIGKNNTMSAKVDGYSKDIPVSRQYSPALRVIVGLRKRNSAKK